MSLRSLIILEKLVFCELCLLISLLEVRLFSVKRPLIFCEFWPLIYLLEKSYFLWTCWPDRIDIFETPDYVLWVLTAYFSSRKVRLFFVTSVSLLTAYFYSRTSAYFLWVFTAYFSSRKVHLFSVSLLTAYFYSLFSVSLDRLFFSRKVRLFSVNLLTAYLYSRNVRLFSVSFDRLFRFSKSPLIFCELVDRLFIFFIFCEFRPLIFSLGKSAYLYILETSAYFLWVLTAYFSSRKVRLFSVSLLTAYFLWAVDR